MKNIILDCDPGHDDMVAIILALSSPEINLLGITTVAGNQIVDKTFNNALRILTLLGVKGIPVTRGSEKPILRVLKTAPEFHGISGLDGAELPEPKNMGLQTNSIDFIVDTLQKSKDKIYIVATGPLTNIAISILKAPEIKSKIERIVLMGGAIHDSNITPSAEFNIYVDPEAAKVVFDSGIPLTMVGLDVTNRCVFTFEEIKTLKNSKKSLSRIIGNLLQYFAQSNLKYYGIEGAPLHDPLTVAYTINKDILKVKEYHVDIETKGEYTTGATVVDIYGISGKNPNAEVAVDVDVGMYKSMIFEAIKFFEKSI